MAERLSRSFIKALSWRVIGFANTFTALWIFSNVHVALKVVLIREAAAVLLYVSHERIWNRIPFGKNGCS